MSRDVDEDLIEATIRRIAASKAAGQAQDAPDESDIKPSAAATSLIESTIRRVAASKAAGIAEEAAGHDTAPADEDPIEATIRRVAASAAEAAREQGDATDDAPEAVAGPPDLRIVPPSEPDDVVSAPAAEREPVDESLIEATLRRIESEQAARSEPPAVAESTSNDSFSAADFEARPTQTDIQTASEQVAIAEAPAAGGDWVEVAHALRRDLDETQRKLQALTERVEALLGDESAPQPLRPAQTIAPKQQLADDDWDDAPQLPRMPIGAPPRPAILRDPSPQTATAAQLEYRSPAPASTSVPAPTQAPPQAVDPEPPAAAPLEAKRGFDLLPRTYRITVEDKRRGVDLVPLHRALLGMDGVRDMSLLSYSNGTAIVALETTNELIPDVLGKAVSHAMAREVKVEVHNEQTMVIKLAED
jgi:hypothetical protein